MREIFQGYYRPSEEEFTKLWQECFFAFDANVLLNVYRYSAETRESLLSILKSIQDRCWIAYQAALEFHENRPHVIYEQIDAYKRHQNPLSEFEEALANKRKHPFVASDTLDELKKGLLAVQRELDLRRQYYEKLVTADDILDEITAIFTGRTGSRFPEEKETEIRKRGEGRYKSKVPPGFKDEAKGDPRKFGDLLLWFQMIEEAKKRQQPVVLVTDDSKEDWWWIVNGRTIGPRPELVEEMRREANVQFYAYQPDSFMTYFETFLKQQVKQEAIQEVREVADQQVQERMVVEGIIEEVQQQIAPHDVAAALASRPVSIQDLARRFCEQPDLLSKIASPNVPALQELALRAAEIGTGSLFPMPPAISRLRRMIAEHPDLLSKFASPSVDVLRVLSKPLTAPSESGPAPEMDKGRSDEDVKKPSNQTD